MALAAPGAPAPAGPPPGWVPAVGPTGATPWPGGGPGGAVGATGAPTTLRRELPPPEASTRPYVRPTGTAWGLFVLAVLAALLSLATRSEAQLAVAVALLAGIVLDALTARYALSALAIRVDGAADAVAGRPTRWQLHVDGLRRPVALSPTLLPRPPGVLVDRGEPGLLVLPAASRGVLHHFYLDAHATGPIGLFEAGRRFRVSPPTPVPLGPGPLPVDHEWPTPKAVGFGLSPVAPRGDDLFRAVRPYQRGDERRHIHWKASAHHGELMVRESDGVGVVGLQIVVDLGQPGPRAELTASVAAFVAEEAVRKGWLVQLVTLDSSSAPPPLVQLGSPFGAPPIQPPAPVRRLETQALRVSSPTAIRHQLATAAYGTPQAPEWSGLVCRITPDGVVWP
ncbi:DUF58 domain-containing protein [Aquihabitans sp. G128]|uniref:DUF58 domain-containing protein n=1 Tax=Aquihabitans sp. G128 TaxID=2849779 RepID=UPI001C227412|nr:DUF58 domain-containing protein [Aquihabitans sp. G128]QXC59214.1 DUF58 domain-containing protein [Aquihabitans sp. G128]